MPSDRAAVPERHFCERCGFFSSRLADVERHIYYGDCILRGLRRG